MAAIDLRDRVALVTGAARGSGWDITQTLYQRGARVVLVDWDNAATTESTMRLGGRALGISADVTDAAAMQEVVADAVDRLGRLDIVVTTARVTPRLDLVGDMEPAAFERVLEVNVLGAYRTVHAALPHVISNQGHVTLVGVAHSIRPAPTSAPYAMSQASLVEFAAVLREELAPHGASAGVAYLSPQTASAGPLVVDGIEQRSGRVDPETPPTHEFVASGSSGAT